jgi:hypothetical protein
MGRKKGDIMDPSSSENVFLQDLKDRIKKNLCEFATYRGSEGTYWPECGRGSATCPRPQICEDHEPGCLRIDSYFAKCMKLPGKPCPKNICPIAQRDWEVEQNSMRVCRAVKRYEKRKNQV